MTSEIKLRIVYVLTRTNKANDDDDTDIYVASTSKNLNERLAEHRCVAKSKNSKLYERMREVDIYNWEIIPLLSRTCDKKTILELERKWIKIMNADLNTLSPIITPDERKTYLVNYYKLNKKDILRKHTEYNKSIKQKKVHYCEVCNMSFEFNYNLQKHLKTSKHFWKYIYSVD